MEPEAFVASLLALDGVVEKSHFGKRDFRLRGKIIASLPAVDRAVVKFSPDRQLMAVALAPDVFSPVPNGWGQKGWTNVILAALTDELAGQLLGWAVEDCTAPGKNAGGKPQRDADR